MEKIAVISDVHGNMPALEAVLTDIRQRGIDLIHNLGDLVGKGAYSDQAVDRCRAICQVIVRGNWDDGLLNPDIDPDGQWYRRQLGVERLAYLDTLPGLYDFWLSGKRVRLYHASAVGIYHRVHPWQPITVHEAMFENTPFTGHDNPPPDIVGYGDIHSACLLSLHHKTLFNAGSVGNPLDTPLASYVILTGALDSQQPGLFSVDFVRVAYDIEQAIADARAVGVPAADAYSVELREAVYRGRQK